MNERRQPGKGKKAETGIRLKVATNSSGIVRFTGLQPGVYEVKATSKYLKPFTKEITVKDHTAEQLKMAIDPSKVESENLGVLVEADGLPIETTPIEVTNNLPTVWKASPSGPNRQ